jgi:predicted transcriptional regulator YdeE
MEYEIVQLEPRTVVGLGINCPGFDTSGIGPKWDELTARKTELPDSPRAWGVSRVAGDGFYYLAAFEVPPGSPTPAGMEVWEIPGDEFLCLPFHDTPDKLGTAFSRIYGELIPRAGRQPAPGALSLEEYAGDWHDEAAGKFRMNLYVQLAQAV